MVGAGDGRRKDSGLAPCGTLWEVGACAHAGCLVAVADGTCDAVQGAVSWVHARGKGAASARLQHMPRQEHPRAVSSTPGLQMGALWLHRSGISPFTPLHSTPPSGPPPPAGARYTVPQPPRRRWQLGAPAEIVWSPSRRKMTAPPQVRPRGPAIEQDAWWECQWPARGAAPSAALLASS